MLGRFCVKTATLSILLLPAFALASTGADEDGIGRAEAGRILAVAPMVENDAAQAYVNLVGNAIAKQTAAGYKWRFALVKSDAVNAFALPGGIVLVTTGMVQLLNNEDELAFVLSHEIAHVLQRHHYKMIMRQRLAEKAANAANSQGGAAATDLGNASAQIYARGLDKGAEFDADRIGVDWMTRAGYDPAAAMAVLSSLAGLATTEPRAEWLLSTHPRPGDRLDRLLQSGIDGLPRPAADKNVMAQRFKVVVQAVGVGKP